MSDEPKKNPLFVPPEFGTAPERNPVIVPDRSGKKPGCPVCGHPEFDGRRVQGVVAWKCRNKDCRNEWYGGLPQVPQDPRIPLPPERYVPPVTFDVGVTKSTKGQIVEINRPVDTRPEFRKGAPITGDDDV